MAATRSAGNNVLLLAIGLVFCAAATIATTPLQMMTNDAAADADDSGAAAAKAAGLSVDFYAAGCSDLDNIVRSAVEAARGPGGAQGAVVTAGLLRIFFHDCFPQGCDASLLLDKTHPGSEQWVEPQNKGLQQVALNLVESIRGTVHGRCGPRSVSCADILALATSHAVKLAGGPFIPMELGRNDSRGPASLQAVLGLPKPTDSFEVLRRSFAEKSQQSLSGSDVVTLSGAHTMGMARCSSFKDKLGKQNKDPFDSGLNRSCGNDMEKKLAFDSTPSIFDNKYFVELVKNGNGLLTSDQALYSDWNSRWLVEQYANKQDDFLNAFKESMLRLSRLKGPDPGPARDNCFRTNFRTNVLETTAGAGAGDDEDLVLAASA